MSGYEEKIRGTGFKDFAKQYPSTATYLANSTARGAGAIRDVIHLSEEETTKILRGVNDPTTKAQAPEIKLVRGTEEELRKAIEERDKKEGKKDKRERPKE